MQVLDYPRGFNRRSSKEKEHNHAGCRGTHRSGSMPQPALLLQALPPQPRTQQQLESSSVQQPCRVEQWEASCRAIHTLHPSWAARGRAIATCDACRYEIALPEYAMNQMACMLKLRLRESPWDLPLQATRSPSLPPSLTLTTT